MESNRIASPIAPLERDKSRRRYLRYVLWCLAASAAAGCAAYGLVFFLRGVAPSLQLLVEQATDLRSLFFADYASPARSAPPIMFLDVDQKTQVSLGRPVLTPPDLLAKMLATVAKGKPRLIILDIDATRSDDLKGADELAGTLVELGDGKIGDGKTPVLLFRIAMVPATEDAPLHWRRSRLDDTVDRKGAYLMWVSAAARASTDGVVRRAPLWFCGSFDDGRHADDRRQRLALPDAALAAWLVLNSDFASAKQQLEGALAKAAAECTFESSGGRGHSPKDEIVLSAPKVSLRNEWPNDSITFSMAWDLEKGVNRPLVSGTDGRLTPVLQIISAEPFTKPSPIEPGSELFRDKVVIIGSSAGDHRDLHPTPLGETPGAVIVANHLRSLFENGVDHRANFWGGLCLSAVASIILCILWISFRMLFPDAPKRVIEVYSITISVIVWILLWMIPVTGVPLFFALIQSFVTIILYFATLWLEPETKPGRD